MYRNDLLANLLATEIMISIWFVEDDVTNFWMYAVIAVGSGFVIFVIVALYTVW